jgi:rubrerythrin
MVSGKEDLLAALIEAYLMEKGTNEFYVFAAGKAVNEDARKAFQDLSCWEAQHMEFIGSLYKAIEQDMDILGFEAFSRNTLSPVSEAGIPVKDLETKFEPCQFTDDKGAIALALEIEGKAFNLYRRLSGAAVDSNARVVFSEMMGQEQKHIDYLTEMRARLA